EIASFDIDVASRQMAPKQRDWNGFAIRSVRFLNETDRRDQKQPIRSRRSRRSVRALRPRESVLSRARGFEHLVGIDGRNLTCPIRAQSRFGFVRPPSFADGISGVDRLE